MSERVLCICTEDGKLAPATAIDRKKFADKLTPGHSYWTEITLPRSVKQNRLLFACIEKAWSMQPSDEWSSPEHLRAFAFCAVGYSESVAFEFPASMSELVAASFATFASDLLRRARGKGGFAFIRKRQGRLLCEWPKSWAFENLEAPGARKVFDDTLWFLCSDDGPCPGTTPEELIASLDDPS